MLKSVIYISYDIIHCAPTASCEPTPLELACVANKHMQMCTEGQWLINLVHFTTWLTQNKLGKLVYSYEDILLELVFFVIHEMFALLIND